MRRGTMKFRLFITCLAIFLLPLILLGLIGGKWVSDTVARNTEESYAATLNNVANRLDSDISNISNVVTLFSSDPLIKRLAYMQGDSVDYKRINAIDLHNYRTSLIFHCANNPLYTDISICFPKKNVVISTLGLWNLNWFLEDEFNIASMSIEDWMALFAAGNDEYLFGNADLTCFGYAKSGLASVRTAFRNSKGEALMSVIFWIDGKKLDAYLADLVLFPGTIAALRDEQGEMIHLFAQNENQEDVLLHLTQIDHSKAYTSFNGEKYRVMELVSSQRNWCYTVLLPQDEIYAQVHELNRAIVMIFAVMLVVGCALSYELAHINYKPLARVLRILSHYLTPQEQGNEGKMVQIESILMNMIAHQDELRQQVDANKDMLQFAALSHLLEGDASFRQAAKSDLLMMLDLNVPYDWFSICVPARGSEHTVQLLSTSQWTGMQLYCVWQKGLPVLIINHACESLAEWTFSLEHQGNGLCLSLAHADIEQLPQAVQEAMTARKYRPANAQCAVFHGQTTPQERVVLLSVQVEQQIIGAVKEGSIEHAMALFEQVVEQNKDRLSHDSAGKIAVAIELAMLKTDVHKGGLAEAISEIQQPNDDRLDTQLVYARRLLEATAAYHQLLHLHRKNAFTQDLLSYIHAHLCDPQLSLMGTAEAFEVSPAFLSRYFKEHMNIGYLEYVNGKRIELAKGMLRKGSVSIKEVALACGFASDATFRRLYKKYEGSAPSKRDAL